MQNLEPSKEQILDLAEVLKVQIWEQEEQHYLGPMPRSLDWEAIVKVLWVHFESKIMENFKTRLHNEFKQALSKALLDFKDTGVLPEHDLALLASETPPPRPKLWNDLIAKHVSEGRITQDRVDNAKARAVAELNTPPTKDEP